MNFCVCSKVVYYNPRKWSLGCGTLRNKFSAFPGPSFQGPIEEREEGLYEQRGVKILMGKPIETVDILILKILPIHHYIC